MSMRTYNGNKHVGIALEDPEPDFALFKNRYITNDHVRMFKEGVCELLLCANRLKEPRAGETFKVFTVAWAWLSRDASGLQQAVG